LLAAELMALALLRFPDAPPGFRRGLLETLREEQIHTRWYLGRLAQCGITLGEYPVSRFFWDAVSPMESPVDYVSRLSLTFEQANLDYARHYAGVLRDAGDRVSAGILDRIYRDEIRHVGYGLSWFRRWKDHGESDWDGLSRRLVFPLSPSRAKGNGAPFNREGRIEAGLEPDYIDRLELFERSKGRTPDVFYFNADAEERISSNGPWHPDKFVRSLTSDLESILLFVARRDDVVLLRTPPPRAFLTRLREAGFDLPEIEPLDSGGDLSPDSLLHERRIHAFRPWAISPELPERFGFLAERAATDSESLEWDETCALRFDKAAIMRDLAPWSGASLWCENGESLAEACSRWREAGYAEAVSKRRVGAAGRGMRRIDLADTRPPFSGPCLVEPLHQREFDFSVQFDMGNEGLRFLGPVRQRIDRVGAYRGSTAALKFCTGLPTEHARFLMEKALPHYRDGSPFFGDLEKWAHRHRIRGPLGVDSYLHRAPGGELVHRVVCEVNARYTMGRVAHEIRKRFAPGHDVHFRIFRVEDLATQPRADHLPSSGSGSGGWIALTPVSGQTRFAAAIRVEKPGATP